MPAQGYSAAPQKFLIHYGWRGTPAVVDVGDDDQRVSNPLRVEGDKAL